MRNLSQPFLTESSTQPSPPDEMMMCPECGGTIFTDVHTGEELCTHCGLVVNEVMVNHGGERRVYDPETEEATSRHGPWRNESTYDRGLNTYMQGTRDAYGNPLSENALTQMRRLQRHDSRSKVSETVARNLSAAMVELDRLSSRLSLPAHAKEYAAHLYRRALTQDMIRGRSIDSFVAACIYLSCRLLSLPRSLKTVVRESGRSYQETSLLYRFMLKEFGVKPPVDEPAKFIPHLASAVGVSRRVERRAIQIVDAARGSSALVGKDPRGVAGAALYLALELEGERIVQKRIATEVDTTEVTLRNRYRELKRVLGYE